MKHLFEFQSLESRVLFSLPIASLNLTAMGDFNGDHKADEAIVQRGLAAKNITVTISLGTGLGLFIKSASVTIPNFNPADVAVGDVNGDGFADVVILGSPIANIGPTPLSSAITASQNEVLVLLGNGKGGFKSTVNTITGSATINETTYVVPNLLSVSSVAVGDFDGDGFTDVAVLGQAAQNAITTTVTGIASVIPKVGSAIDMLWDVSKPSLAPGIKTGVTTSPVSNSTLVTLPSNPNVNTLFAGDLDGDTKTDLVAALSSQVVLPPVLGKTISLGAAISTTPIRPDFATVRFPTAHTPAVTVGTNPFDVAVPVSASVIITSTEQTIGLATLTSGGKLDLVGLRGNSIVYSAYNPATESFRAVQTAQSKNPPLMLSTAKISLADINGDGLPDLLAETVGGTYVGKNTTSSTTGSVLFSWARVILPPSGATPL